MSFSAVLPVRTLRSRLSIGVVVLVGLSVTLVGTIGVIAAHYAEISYRDRTLHDRLDMLQQKLSEERRNVGADGLILANMPPIQGLIRAAQNGGIDPKDGVSTETMWGDRLKQTFTSFHEMHEEYKQIRFIGFSDGKEIVRVDKSPDGVKIVDQENLQNKKNEPYFKIAENLSAGKFHLMSPTFNRENGVIQSPRLVVSRMLVPVFGEDGIRFGFIVINYDTLVTSKKAITSAPPLGDVVVRNTIGGTYFYDASRQRGQIYVENEDVLPADISKALVDGRKGRTLVEVDNKVVAVKPLGVDRPADKQVVLALITDNVRMDGLIGNLSLTVAALGAIIVILSTFIAQFFTRLQLAPFLSMKDEIQRAKFQSERPKLPKDRRDEIGDVAREFDSMLDMLDSREKRMEFFFNGVSDGICIIDSDGKILTINPALESILGYRENELVGQNFEYLLPKWSKVDHGAVLQNLFQIDQEMRLHQTTNDAVQCKNGTQIDVELSIDQIDSGPGFYFAAVIRDISERTRAEAEREALIEALKSSNEELDSFAYVASHDLKAPLRAIETASRWLTTDLEGKLDEDTQETLDLMCSRVLRMDQLLDGLLEHARIGRKTGDTKSRVLTGAELCCELRELVDRPPSFTINFSDNFSTMLFQQMPLRTVFLNLISNAIKHHDRTDGTVTIDVETVDDKLLFSVTDDGPGIDPMFHDRVFRLFQTLKSRDRLEGSGLGLAMCRKQVRLMGGDIALISEGDGKGSVFTFTWPTLVSGESENAA